MLILFSESEQGEVWYYTTVLQFEELLKMLDANDMESVLCRELQEYKDEIIRQMELTEKLTNQFKGNKKTYLDSENGKCDYYRLFYMLLILHQLQR